MRNVLILHYFAFPRKASMKQEDYTVYPLLLHIYIRIGDLTFYFYFFLEAGSIVDLKCCDSFFLLYFDRIKDL